MRKVRIFHQGPVEGGQIVLDPENVHYVKDVLRLGEGSEVEVLSPSNEVYKGILIRDGRSYLVTNLVRLQTEPKNGPEINLYIGVIKGSAMDYAIEKASEIGATSITPVYCEYSSLRRITDERLYRFRRIAISSALQCRRIPPLQVRKAIGFDEIFSMKLNGNNLFLHPYSKDSLSNFFDRVADYRRPFNIFSGPEGGFSEKEVEQFIENGFFCASLGENILRAETIPLVICSIIIYEHSRRYLDGG